MGATLIAGACGGAENDNTLDPVDSNAPAASDTNRGAEREISGNLGKVDSDARTFTLNADNREQTFRYNDGTQVTGASGTQGLAGREGARVTVHYRQEGPAMMAMRIVIAEGGAAPQSSRPQQQPGSPPPTR